jgi:hypothetical protein
MNDFEKAVERYLEDYADNVRAVILWQDLTKYGFSGVWLRDMEESHLYRAAKGNIIDKQGVGTFDLLKAIALELGIGEEELKTAAVQILNQQSGIEQGELKAAADQILKYQFEIGQVKVDSEEEFKKEELLVTLCEMHMILKQLGIRDPSYHFGTMLTKAIQNRLKLS